MAHRPLVAVDIAIHDFPEVIQHSRRRYVRLGITVRRRNPALRPFIRHSARAAPAFKLKDHLYTVGKKNLHSVSGLVIDVLILYCRRVPRPDSYLALRARMCPPFADTARMEIIMSPPRAVYIGDR